MTGGSTGLGLALAILLVTKGAHVSIVARDQEKLDKALAQLEVRYSSYNPEIDILTCYTTSGFEETT